MGLLTWQNFQKTVPQSSKEALRVNRISLIFSQEPIKEYLLCAGEFLWRLVFLWCLQASNYNVHTLLSLRIGENVGCTGVNMEVSDW